MVISVAATTTVTHSAVGQLPNCTITFDAGCPDAGAQCGATFGSTGVGDTCIFAGLGNCYSTGIRAFRVSPGATATITLSGDLNSLRVFLAHEIAGGAGTMTFFDGLGVQVDAPLTTNGVCGGLVMPPTQLVFFSRSVRSITVVNTGAGNVWIDTFEVNPPCVGAGDCDDGDPCTVDDCMGGACVHTPVDCDDGDPCTTDTCVGGNCVHTPTVSKDCPQIPAMSNVGMAVLIVMLVGTGVVMIRRGRRAIV